MLKGLIVNQPDYQSLKFNFLLFTFLLLVCMKQSCHEIAEGKAREMNKK